MNSLGRLVTYRNSLAINRMITMLYKRYKGIARNYPKRRTYPSRKDIVIDKLKDLEQKIKLVVENRIRNSLKRKCKLQDSSLPDCKKPQRSSSQNVCRRVPVRPLSSPGGRKWFHHPIHYKSQSYNQHYYYYYL